MVLAENIKEEKTVEAHIGTSSSVSEFIGTEVSLVFVLCKFID